MSDQKTCWWCDGLLRAPKTTYDRIVYGLCDDCYPIYDNCNGIPVLEVHGPQGPQGPYHVHDHNCTGTDPSDNGLCRRK